MYIWPFTVLSPVSRHGRNKRPPTIPKPIRDKCRLTVFVICINPAAFKVCFHNLSTNSILNKLCYFSNLSITSSMSQLILQPFCRFTYVTAHSSTLPLLHLRHSSFSNPSFSSPKSQALHLRHLASRPWCVVIKYFRAFPQSQFQWDDVIGSQWACLEGVIWEIGIIT